VQRAKRVESTALHLEYARNLTQRKTTVLDVLLVIKRRGERFIRDVVAHIAKAVGCGSHKNRNGVGLSRKRSTGRACSGAAVTNNDVWGIGIKILAQSRGDYLATLHGQERLLASTRHLMDIFAGIFFSDFKHEFTPDNNAWLRSSGVKRSDDIDPDLNQL
jgi:hypothetical protein